MIIRLIMVGFFLGLSSVSRANMVIDVQATYLSDQFKYATTSNWNLMLYSTSLNFVMNKSKTLFFGWNILSLSQTYNDGSSTNAFTTMDMGPRILWLSKSGDYQLGISYNLRNTTTYTEGSSQPIALRGSSILLELGLLPEISDGVRLGIKLNYYNPTWTETLEGTTTLTQVAYNRATLLPTIALGIIF